MVRVLVVVLLAALLTPPALRAGDRQDASPPLEPAAGPEPTGQEEAGAHGLAGLLIGAAAGVAVGFALAAATDFALKEGGASAVILAGSALGGFVGHKVGSSLGRPWEEPGRLGVSLDCGWATTVGGSPVQSAFGAAGFPATNDHHPVVPAVAATWAIGRRFNAGLELSGLSAQSYRASGTATYLTEDLGGHSWGAIVELAPPPSARRRLTWGLGAGLDWYNVTVESYFDPMGEGLYPPDQPTRAIRTSDTSLGVQVRGHLEYWLVHDVSLRAGVVGRWVQPIRVEGISLTLPGPDPAPSLAAHSVDLSSVQLSLGVEMRF